MKKFTSIAVSFIMVAVILVGCNTKPAEANNSSTAVAKATVTIEMDLNGEITKKEIATNDKTVEELLVANTTELGLTLTDSEYGKFVAGINDYLADVAKNEFVEFFVNGTSSQVGIAEVEIADKDTYTFKISTF